MTKISLELDAALNKRLKQYAIDHYEMSHGKQQAIIRDALIAFLDANELRRIPKTPTQTITLTEPEEVEAEIVEVCKPEPPVTKPKVSKPKKAKGQTRTKISLTDADREYIKTQRLAGMGLTEIGKGMTPARRPSVVKAAIESMVKKGELQADALKKSKDIK